MMQDKTFKRSLCQGKKKNVHLLPCKRSHAHASPPTASQTTEPAAFALMFYSYACTDVRYWRGGVPINLWIQTPHIYLH